MTDERSHRPDGSTDPQAAASGKKLRKPAASTGRESRPDQPDDAAEPRQLTLDDLDRRPRCEAFADSTGEQCKHDAIYPYNYCDDHFQFADHDKILRKRLKRTKSEG